MKQATNLSECLYDTGLLFHINRTILHPLGMELALVIYDDGSPERLELHATQDPEGVYFDKDSLERGFAKCEAYANGPKMFPKLRARFDALGFVVQGGE